MTFTKIAGTTTAFMLLLGVAAAQAATSRTARRQ